MVHRPPTSPPNSESLEKAKSIILKTAVNYGILRVLKSCSRILVLYLDSLGNSKDKTENFAYSGIYKTNCNDWRKVLWISWTSVYNTLQRTLHTYKTRRILKIIIFSIFTSFRKKNVLKLFKHALVKRVVDAYKSLRKLKLKTLRIITRTLRQRPFMRILVSSFV